MADGYSWSETRDTATYRLPGPEHIGWWAAFAMLLSILLHIGVFLMLNGMKITLHFQGPAELSTNPVVVRPMDPSAADTEPIAPPENLIQPPEDSAALLEEIDLLAALPKDQPIDVNPQVSEPEYALSMQKPAAEGDPAAIAMEVSSGLQMDVDAPAMGREPERIKPAEVGQLTVDPGAVHMDDDKLGTFTDDLIKRGANGKVDKGAMDGVASLDTLLDLPPNLLLSKKTMLPSDLLFEFNSDELKESAKVGLMKLALLMDRNPKMYCWVEGHTDLVGGDDFNLNLSVRRAEAVKSYLVNSLRMNPDKIATRGFGRFAPLVTTGSRDEQAANRRVEIRMRNELPDKEQMKIAPQKATVVPETPKTTAKPVQETPPPPKAVLVKPKRALPLDENGYLIPEATPPPPPKAKPVHEGTPAAPPLKAKPVEEPPATPLRAEPVVE